MYAETLKYNRRQGAEHKLVCDVLAHEIDNALANADNKIWHAHPVWFLNENPIVGYSKQKPGIRLMFGAAQILRKQKLDVVGKKFKDASVFLNDVSEVLGAICGDG